MRWRASLSEGPSHPEAEKLQQPKFMLHKQETEVKMPDKARSDVMDTSLFASDNQKMAIELAVISQTS